MTKEFKIQTYECCVYLASDELLDIAKVSLINIRRNSFAIEWTVPLNAQINSLKNKIYWLRIYRLYIYKLV